MLETPRLRLFPATIALARAEIEDRPAFARLANAVVPDNWPPENIADVLPLFLHWLETTPNADGWFAWYVVNHAENTQDTLIGGIGFKGPPKNGTVEIGYSVLPQFQRHGFATEMVQMLTAWAFRQPGVSRVIAETEPTNVASLRVLHKAGYRQGGEAAETGHQRFEIVAPCQPASEPA